MLVAAASPSSLRPEMTCSFCVDGKGGAMWLKEEDDDFDEDDDDFDDDDDDEDDEDDDEEWNTDE
jgi:hypothetical protein